MESASALICQMSFQHKCIKYFSLPLVHKGGPTGPNNEKLISCE